MRVINNSDLPSRLPRAFSANERLQSSPSDFVPNFDTVQYPKKILHQRPYDSPSVLLFPWLSLCWHKNRKDLLLYFLFLTVCDGREHRLDSDRLLTYLRAVFEKMSGEDDVGSLSSAPSVEEGLIKSSLGGSNAGGLKDDDMSSKASTAYSDKDRSTNSSQKKEKFGKYPANFEDSRKTKVRISLN